MVEDLRLIKFPDFFPKIWERYAALPTIFSVIVLFSGCFGGMGVKQTPKALSNAIDHPVARFIFVSLIAFTATSDIETALFTTFVFFAFLHLLRTNEEREEVGGLL